MMWRPLGQIPIVPASINLLFVIFCLFREQRFVRLFRIHPSTVTHKSEVVTWESV